MFDTPVLNVAIGLVFCFAATALAASTLTEALASLLKLRANSLVSGVQQMLNDPKFDGLALAVYNHALVHPQGSGEMGSRNRFWTYKGPSYIQSNNFATAMVDVLSEAPGDIDRMLARIDTLPDPQLRQLLAGMVVRARGDVAQLHGQIAGWFDTSMDRVSGAYKRQAQLICVLAALLLAVTINVDATHVVTALWRNPTLAHSIAERVAPPDATASRTASAPADAASGAAPEAPTKAAALSPKQAFDLLTELPVGPQLMQGCDGKELMCVAARGVTGYNLLGWLITAVASVFGAPFWFDMLSKLVQLRGSGPKPNP